MANASEALGTPNAPVNDSENDSRTSKWALAIPAGIMILFVVGLAPLFSASGGSSSSSLAWEAFKRADADPPPSLRELAMASLREGAAVEAEDDAKAEQLYHQALRQSLEAGDYATASLSLRLLGDLKGSYGDALRKDGDADAAVAAFAEADALLNQALDLSRAHELAQEECLVLQAMATLEKRRGRLDVAASRYREALQLFSTTIGLDPRVECSIEADLGNIRRQTHGDVETVREAREKCLETYRDLGDVPRQAYSYWMLGSNAIDRLAFDEAIDDLEASSDLWKQVAEFGKPEEWDRKSFAWWQWLATQDTMLARVLELEDLLERDGAHLSKAGNVRANALRSGGATLVHAVRDDAERFRDKSFAQAHLRYAELTAATYDRLVGLHPASVQATLEDLTRNDDDELAFMAARELARFYLDHADCERFASVVDAALDTYRPAHDNVPLLKLYREELLIWQQQPCQTANRHLDSIGKNESVR